MGSNVLSAIRSLSRNDILPWMPALGSASLAIAVDQLAYRLFSTRASSRWAHCAAALTGVATLAAASFKLSATPALRLAAPGLYVVYKMVQLVWNSKTSPNSAAAKPALPRKPLTPIDEIRLRIKTLILEIDKKSDEEALYRNDNLKPAQKELLESNIANDTLDIKDIPIPAMATAIKIFLKKINPLLLQPQYEAFQAALKGEDATAKNELFQKAIQGLPLDRRRLLQTLILHLARVCKAQQNNPLDKRMTSEGLASMFGPLLFDTAVPPGMSPSDAYLTVFKPVNSIIQYLIDNSENFFPSATG